MTPDQDPLHSGVTGLLLRNSPELLLAGILANSAVSALVEKKPEEAVPVFVAALIAYGITRLGDFIIHGYLNPQFPKPLHEGTGCLEDALHAVYLLAAINAWMYAIYRIVDFKVNSGQ